MNFQKLRNMPRRTLITVAVVLLAITATAVVVLGKEDHAGEGDTHAEQAEHAGEKKDEHGSSEELTLTTEEAQRAGIKVEEAKAESTAQTVVTTATIQPNQERIAYVAPRIEGRVTSVPARLGDRVRAGQVLATLDSVVVGEAYAAYVQAQAELRIAESDFKRAESLVADEIIPRKDFLRARAERDKAAAALRNATDRLRLLGGSPNSKGSVSGFAVTSPISGTVIEKKATLGGLATPAEPVFTVADLSRVWIQADLPEAALAKVQIGASAKVTVPAYPNEVFSGRVSHIGAGLNKETRTASARIEVQNPNERLKPEMFATAAIEVKGLVRSGIALPDEAIVLMQGQPTVFVFEQGAYVGRTVQPGERLGGRTVINSGIRPGEQVVTAGAYALKARKQKSQLGHGH